MNTNPQIQNLVNGFVQQLTTVWQQSVIDALGSVGGPPAFSKNGKATKSPNGNAHASDRANGHASDRAKGAKRNPEEIAATKAQFLEFVTANGGLRIEQINKELGTSTKDLALPIRQLLAEKMIKAKGQKRSTTYFGK